MYIDSQSQFMDDEAITTAATYVGDAIDIDDDSADARQIGNGENVPVVFQVTETFNAGTNALFQICEADNDALTTNPIVLAATPVFLTAALVAGTMVTLSVPVKRLTKQFFGARVISTGTHDAGKVSSWIPLGGIQTADQGFTAVTGF